MSIGEKIIKNINEDDKMKKYITQDNLCYFKDKNGIVCSRNATTSEILSRNESKLQTDIWEMIQ